MDKKLSPQFDAPVPKQVDDYTKMLNDGTQFTMANIGGDGEFLTITGWDGTNSDGRTSTPEKAEALAKVLLEPRLSLHGYNSGRLGSDKERNAINWLFSHNINMPDRSHSMLRDPDYGLESINVRWVHKEIISSANVNGRLGPFLAAIQRRPLIVVGPGWLDSGDFLDRLGVYWRVSRVLFDTETGFESIDDIEQLAREALDTAPLDTVITWSLGYLTKILMWKLAPDYPEMTQIDMGACWDPYCGVYNRHGYRRPEWAEAMKTNLKGLE